MSAELSFDYLRTFLAAYRAGSLTAAAHIVGISQPAVSGQIQALERQLGYSLFVRRGRGIEPTSRAVALALEVEKHLDGLERVTQSSFVPSLDRPRTIHLGGPAEFLSTCVVPLLAELGGGTLRFRLSFGLPDGLLDELVAGDLDIVVSSVLPRRKGVASIPLVDEEFLLVSAPRWAETIAGEASAAALKTVPVVSYSEELPIVRRYWRTIFGVRPEGLETAATIPDLRAIADAVAGGMGMSVLPRYLVADRVRSGELVTLLDPEIAPLNTLHLATQAGALPRDAVLRSLQNSLVSLIRKTLAEG